MQRYHLNETVTSDLGQAARLLVADEIDAVSAGVGCGINPAGDRDLDPSWADIYNSWAARGRTLAAVSKALG
jgi:hypothetical protein